LIFAFLFKIFETPQDSNFQNGECLDSLSHTYKNVFKSKKFLLTNFPSHALTFKHVFKHDFLINFKQLLILDFSNLVVRIKIFKQNIGTISFLDHLVRQNIINIYFASYGDPKIKFSFQISNIQMVISEF
jgi:hypothetical protein